MTTDGELLENPGGRGLFDGFEGYRTPTPAELDDVLRGGLVVLDANVLLNLYRYTEQARDDLLRGLEKLGDRLWIPHRVLDEFWGSRDSVLRDPRATESVLKDLDRARATVRQALNTWARRVSLPVDRAEEIAGPLTHAFDVAAEDVGEFADRSAAQAARDTATDAVLARLEPLLAGRVGPPFQTEDLAAAEQEGQRRLGAKEPPGFKDSGKDPARAIGDYLVWAQLLEEAGRRRADVLFVTADTKEDWWRTVGGDRRGPHLQLVEEMRERSSGRLFMLTPAEFMRTAEPALGVTPHAESVELADALEQVVVNLDGLRSLFNYDSAEYWFDYLSDNARDVYRAAVEIQDRDGPGYTLDDIADQLQISYESVRAIRRNSGRAARRWRSDTGHEPPIELEWTDYREAGPDGAMRTVYQFPPDTIDEVRALVERT